MVVLDVVVCWRPTSKKKRRRPIRTLESKHDFQPRDDTMSIQIFSIHDQLNGYGQAARAELTAAFLFLAEVDSALQLSEIAQLAQATETPAEHAFSLPSPTT
jgi:hypothetical protein